VKFIEDDDAILFERRIALQHACQHALGHDFNACARTDPGIEADAVSDGLPDSLAQRSSHEPGSRARGQSTRLEHDDAAILKPVRAHEGKWHARGFASPGRRLEHEAAVNAQRVDDFVDQVVNGKMHRFRLTCGLRHCIRLSIVIPWRVKKKSCRVRP